MSLLYLESKKLKLENRIRNYFNNFKEKNIYLNQISDKIDRRMYLNSLSKIKTISNQLQKTITSTSTTTTTNLEKYYNTLLYHFNSIGFNVYFRDYSTETLRQLYHSYLNQQEKLEHDIVSKIKSF